ncbi:hypothetical protein AJ79_06318 [Helicocarpus griseus UAMH5409]|uniref:Uncharacterized protein n=1 Tax=Helicocarpus griseus UAMH5409 TaxID=1447875 RepID=A0A2B7X6C7_9EURO|nr:hypothetical protein AJ79_06318 [Helicocarpus griseus UAMH5409]
MVKKSSAMKSEEAVNLMAEIRADSKVESSLSDIALYPIWLAYKAEELTGQSALIAEGTGPRDFVLPDDVETRSVKLPDEHQYYC